MANKTAVLFNLLHHTNAKQCFTRHCFTDKRFVRNGYFTRFIMVMPNSYSKEIGRATRSKVKKIIFLNALLKHKKPQVVKKINFPIFLLQELSSYICYYLV